MNLKKKLMVIFAAGIMTLSAAPFALAATTPAPADNTVQEQQTSESGINAQGEAEGFVNKKYLTKGGAAFWIIFTIVLNGALSFWIGNRFYRMSKKDNHLSSEIRALRRDIDEKFVKNIGGFVEQELDIKNLNENLSADEEGIKTPEKQPVISDISAEEEERFRKWEESQTKSKTERKKNRSQLREELQDDMDDVKKIKRKNYQPSRRASIADDIDDAEEEENLEETKEIKIKNSAVKNKAKEIINDIFPFKED